MIHGFERVGVLVNFEKLDNAQNAGATPPMRIDYNLAELNPTRDSILNPLIDYGRYARGDLRALKNLKQTELGCRSSVTLPLLITCSPRTNALAS